MISGCDPPPNVYFDLDIAVLDMLMIIFNNVWLMKPIAASNSSNLNRLAMVGVFSLRAKAIAAEN